MMWWDDKLIEALEDMNIKMIAWARYMDDIRIWLHGVRLGWRLVNGKMIFKKEWRQEERQAGMTGLQKTTEILKGILNGICV